MGQFTDTRLERILRGSFFVHDIQDMAKEWLAERKETQKALAIAKSELGAARNRIEILKHVAYMKTYAAAPGKITEMLKKGGIKPGTFIPVDGNPCKVDPKTLVIDGVTAASSEMMVMARADFAVTLMLAGPGDPNTNKFWVSIVKNKKGGTSRHAFERLDDTLSFVKGAINEAAHW